MRFGSKFLLGLAFAGAMGCHQRPKTYEPEVWVTRVSVVRKDESGKPITIDVELDYPPCPGEQKEVVRGNADFAACVSKFKVGDRTKAKVVHSWDPGGYYRWDVVDVGGCAREPEPFDEASFAMIRECEDWIVNGATVGFKCNIAPEKKLLKACPWFARH
jgi:hypothetical protein